MKKLSTFILLFSLANCIFGQEEIAAEVVPTEEITVQTEEAPAQPEQTIQPEENPAQPEQADEHTIETAPKEETTSSEPEGALSTESDTEASAKAGTYTEVEEEPSAGQEETEEKPSYTPLTLPGTTRPEVEAFRQMYLTEKWSSHLQSILEGALDYRLYVRNAITAAELPPELEYLPVVESSYKTNAKSKSGAIGMWQFMENSVKPFLTLNEYVDERLDPWKSTDAALKKLNENYNYFHDWLIAIAAYNCGTGAMNRILNKAEEKDFWYLVDHNLLPKQTADYVPKLLAIADLAVNHEYYGIELPLHEEEYEVLYDEKNGTFDYVSVKKAYSLTQLATEMRLDQNTLKKLNPSFVKGFTHPSYTSKIRVPSGMGQTATEALSKIEPIDFPFKYKVVAGDSLWSISRKYGVTVKQLCEINGIEENAILRIGKILYIPSK